MPQPHVSNPQSAIRNPQLSVGASPIESVIFCGQLGPQRGGFSFNATSLPGHLIHIVTSGRVRQECNGREYLLTPGCAIWYHEDELVRGTVLEGPWIWYSCGFIARTLPPPSFEHRMFHPPLKKVVPPFKEMLAAWQDHALPPALRIFKVHAGLLQILSILTQPAQSPSRIDPRARVWWDVETELRKNLERRIDLALMEEISGRSQATIARSCLYAVGIPPLKRIKQVRMSLARGLVQRSELSMSEIAARIGYTRVHEFSRDYRKHFGLPPTQARGGKTPD